MIQSITANLMTEDVDAGIRFYETVLGFSVAAAMPGDGSKSVFAILVRDNLTLMLQQRESLTEEYPSLSTDKVKPGITLYMMVDDFDQMYVQVKEKTSLLVDRHKTFYGKEEFAIADQNGYVVTIAESND